MNDEKRNNYIQIRLNNSEKELLEHKMKLSKCKSKSKFIRQMISEGIILHFDEEKIRKLLRAFSGISNNINQITLRVNSTGNIYENDMKEIKENIAELSNQIIYFTSLLKRLKP